MTEVQANLNLIGGQAPTLEAFLPVALIKSGQTMA